MKKRELEKERVSAMIEDPEKKEMDVFFYQKSSEYFWTWIWKVGCTIPMMLLPFSVFFLAERSLAV